MRALRMYIQYSITMHMDKQINYTILCYDHVYMRMLSYSFNVSCACMDAAGNQSLQSSVVLTESLPHNTMILSWGSHSLSSGNSLPNCTSWNNSTVEDSTLIILSLAL